MLAGRYPADDFSGLRPRIVWDRKRGVVRAREGTQQVVVANAGTIPDRGLYGVFLAAGAGAGRRVGELDEEMVFESREGDVFVLGASSWRIVAITHDRVLVDPAPGEPGEMPFWKADRGARSVELGRAIGRLTRELAALPREAARERLRSEHDFDARAAHNLVQYLDDQRAATTSLPDDKHARARADARRDGGLAAHPAVALGRPRPRAVDDRARGAPAGSRRAGARVGLERRRHRAAAAGARAAARGGGAAAAGRRDRRPGGARAAGDEPVRRALPRGGGAGAAAAAAPGRAALAALDAAEARSRAAADRRALSVVPDRARGGARVPGRRVRRAGARGAGARGRAPRGPAGHRRHAGALALRVVAALRLRRELPLRRRRAARRAARAGAERRHRAAPGAGRRRRAAGAGRPRRRSPTSSSRCRRSARDAEPRARTPSTTCCAGSATSRSRRSRRACGRPRRQAPAEAAKAWLDTLVSEARAIVVRVAGEERYAAAEDAGRLRDALGTSLPAGLPAAFLEPQPRALLDLVGRYARTHGPFHAAESAQRLGIPEAQVEQALVDARAGRARAAGGVPSRRPRPRVVRRRRAEGAAAPIARGAPQAGRARRRPRRSRG